MITVLKALAPSWLTIDDSRFLLKPLSGLGKLNLLANQKTDIIRFSSDITTESIVECLLDWSDVLDSEGKEVIFPGGRAAIKMLDHQTLNVIMSEIFNTAFAPDEETKKKSSLD